jgi:hypothetical protein
VTSAMMEEEVRVVACAPENRPPGSIKGLSGSESRAGLAGAR